MMGRYQSGRLSKVFRFILIVAIGASLVAGGCGDATGVWPRYKLEQAYYRAQKQLDRADLQGKSGQPADLPALRAAFAGVVDLYRRTIPEAAGHDSVVHLLGAQAYLRLADVYVADSEFREAANQYDTVASGTQFPSQFRNMALMGLGRMDERLGDYPAAAEHYQQLLETFFPPVGNGGVNREVMALARRVIQIGRDHLPDSVPTWEARGIAYYDSLARAYQYTDVGMTALGELGTLYAEKEQWQDVIATLNRATDTSGAIMPPYWIDIGEITADRLGDTARALEIYGRVADRFSESPYRVDADLKRAQIYMRRGQYGQARDLLAALKDKFEDRPAVILPAQLLFASAVEAEGNWERAKNEYLFLITTYPQSLEAVQAALAVARHFVQSGETGRVDEWYNRADELAQALARPDKYPPAVAGKAMDLRVTVAAQQKHWDDAAARLNDIVNAYSDRSTAGANALFRLGLMQLREQADTAAAAATWHRLMTAQPNNPQLDMLRNEMKKWPSTYNQDLAS